MIRISTNEIIKKTRGNCDIINLTDDLIDLLRETGMNQGQCTVFSIGSTSAITTVEYEPGLIKDIPEFLDELIPQYKKYHHNDTWGDGNGHSHLRSSLYKSSLTIPFSNGEFYLGTWQQVVFLDFDNRERTRRIIVQFIGE
ncbi:MAG: secondary thiamine-phosphate synthase enzyme YjbQ [Ignavibacteriae bacterium]|nr:secondary thiamine-phosphate synthase enzyme YjbQ [Ignavibacteriota bacterium]MCB0723431.1 secondary thiamine-phosphate synthase enzyme YjbQ [Ignavibacteriota bacterium]MCB9243277.1 YjbQ family protein [Ignavibacteriales bacterium]